MNLPFTTAEFFAVFVSYNQAVWPVQVGLVAGAIAIVMLSLRNSPGSSRSILLGLSSLWLWMGVVYHGLFFSQINPAAYGFAGLFVLQATLLGVMAVRAPATIRPRRGLVGGIGWLLIGYGLVIYPLLGYVLGHRYPANPTFGLPCPTTIFTIGMLLWVRPLRVGLLVIPCLWGLVGTTAALRLGVYEDGGLLVAVIAVVVSVLATRRSAREATVSTVAA